MKFAVDTITLWSKKGEKRQLHFKQDKINVLTGGSHRGKSAILDIFDYCFLSSTHRISESIINENVAWYGITFAINAKNYTIARRSPNGNTVSGDIYFSSVGDIPEIPRATIKIDDLKGLLEAEFKIDDAVKIAYGGKALRASSKVSFRYFFLFNTISEDIITSRDTFFDKQSEERYREALPRIFDLALGIDTLQNIANREKREQLERELANQAKKAARIKQGSSEFDGDLRDLAAKAASYGLSSIAPENLTPSSLQAMLMEASLPSQSDTLHQYSNISAAIFDIDRRLRKLRLFSSEVSQYKKTTAKIHDSLKPIEEILSQSNYIIKSEIFDALITGIKADLSEVKKATAKNQPVDGQIREIELSLVAQKAKLIQHQKSLPAAPQSFDTEKEKWLFIGEALGKLNTYFPPSQPDSSTIAPEFSDLQRQIDELSVEDVQKKKDAVLSLINEIAKKLLEKTKRALDNYSDWYPEFIYSEKRLRLRMPLSSLIENVGSSSNHMFMHLLHFLSLHETAMAQESPFIPSFLIIDQPSRPYYPEKKPKDGVELDSDDNALVRIAFELLDDFISTTKARRGREFQMIVFEHVSADAFEGLENVHVLPELRGQERLIPESWYEASSS